MSLDQKHLFAVECPKYKDQECRCPKPIRDPAFYPWMKKNADILKDVFDKTGTRGMGEGKASLDTPGFLPLRYQQPM